MKKFFWVVAAFVLAAPPVAAKEGSYIGAFVLPTAKISGVSGVDSGSGYGFRAGSGFNRYFSIEGSIEMAEYDMTAAAKGDLKVLAIDAKVNFPLTELDNSNIMSLEPYIRLGYGIGDFDPENGKPSSGNGVRIGFGIELNLFKELSVNAGWTKTNVSFDAPIGKDADVRSIDIGLNYHFI